MNGCLFCQLIKERTVDFVYESPNVVAFTDIDPKAAIHILVVPRQHIRSVLELSEADRTLIGDLYLAARQIIKDKQLAQSGFRCVINTGPAAGQTIHHLHMHILGGQPLGAMSRPLFQDFKRPKKSRAR